MPEYLTPGVYLEETSFRSRSIEGVATSTFGMAGLTRYGPVPYVATMPSRQPGGHGRRAGAGHQLHRVRARLRRPGTSRYRQTTPDNYLAYAARAFFGNGGRRLYVARVFPFAVDANNVVDVAANFAALPVRGDTGQWPPGGPAGRARPASEISVQVGFERSKNVLVPQAAPGRPPRLAGVQARRRGRAVRRRRSAERCHQHHARRVDATSAIIAETNGVLGYRNSTGTGSMRSARSPG